MHQAPGFVFRIGGGGAAVPAALGNHGYFEVAGSLHHLISEFQAWEPAPGRVRVPAKEDLVLP